MKLQVSIVLLIALITPVIVHGFTYGTSQLFSNAYIETDGGLLKNCFINGNYLYAVLFRNATSTFIPDTILMEYPSMYAIKMDLQTHDILQEGYLGERGSDGHYDPDLIIAPNGSIFVFSCYYPSNITYWIGDPLTFQFTKYVTNLRGYSYPCPFILNGNLYLLMRQTVVIVDEDTGMPIGFEMSLAIIDVFHGFNVWQTFWKWSQGNQDSCYYFDLAVENNRVFVATTGQRINSQVEMRKGILFAYSDDVHQWFNMLGTQVTTPQSAMISDVNVSRVTITVTNGKPLIFAGYVWVGQEARYYLAYWSSAWNIIELPVDSPDYPCWIGESQMVNGNIHAVVGVQKTLHYTETCDLIHYCASEPYTSWNKTRFTEGYKTWRNAAVMVRGSDLYVLHFDKDWKQYLTVIDGVVVPEYNNWIFLVSFLIIVLVIVYAKKH